MNKHYRDAVIETAKEELLKDGYIKNTVSDIEAAQKVLEYLMEDPMWEEPNDDVSFEGDVDCLKDMYLQNFWEKEDEEVEEKPKSLEETIEETVSKLHVGFNFVPGIGVGYCSNEEDLEAMKNFVRGGLMSQKIQG